MFVISPLIRGGNHKHIRLSDARAAGHRAPGGPRTTAVPQGWEVSDGDSGISGTQEVSGRDARQGHQDPIAGVTNGVFHGMREVK